MADVTNDKIYDLVYGIRDQVDKVRIELKGDINKVDGKLDGLVAGQLETVQKQVNSLEIKIATAGVKLAVGGFIAASLTGAIISTVLPRLIK